jgi:hypothetical protein
MNQPESSTDPSPQQTSDPVTELTDGNCPDSSPETPQDRRLTRRLLLSSLCTVYWTDKETGKSKRTSGQVHDIAAGGFGLIVRRPLLNGQSVEVRIPLPQRKKYCITGAVIHSRPIDNKLHRVGIRFQEAKIRKLSLYHTLRSYLSGFRRPRPVSPLPEDVRA